MPCSCCLLVLSLKPLRHEPCFATVSWAEMSLVSMPRLGLISCKINIQEPNYKSVGWAASSQGTSTSAGIGTSRVTRKSLLLQLSNLLHSWKVPSVLRWGWCGSWAHPKEAWRNEVTLLSVPDISLVNWKRAWLPWELLLCHMRPRHRSHRLFWGDFPSPRLWHQLPPWLDGQCVLSQSQI